MSRARHVLAIDQGTTSSRAILFDPELRPLASAQRPLQQIFPGDGQVEHDPEHIWADTLAVSREAMETAGVGARDLAAIGLTNQRETTILWERSSGRPIHNAIVWQDRRTAPLCRELEAEGLDFVVRERTGLVLDPYFSATKLAWLLDHVPGARAAAERGELAFGTVDSFLLWRLTGGRVHATDASNAARTMLFDIHRQCWDEEILERLRIPPALLPTVVDCSGELGTTPADLFGAPVPICGMAGDQQAATFGQACFEPGMLKSTYGTGCFALLVTGERAVPSRHRLLTTIAWRIGGRTTYALEGSIFSAGATIQWVRDGLRAIGSAAESAAVAASVPDTGGVHLVPAFTGLGAPWWDPDARGAILGLGRDSTLAHIVRAALESTSFQTFDLLEAMDRDLEAAGLPPARGRLRVDGGMVANDW
ncbi:MAG: glycerol kinase, partial [Geminicoccaceae bacterium]|nr:glycerol kinase [Geminicoccaceae bacterium]